MQSNPTGAAIGLLQPTAAFRQCRPAASRTALAFKALVVIATAFLVASCKDHPEEVTPSSQTHTAAETRLTLTLSATTLATSEMLTATLRAEHPESSQLEFPATTASFGDFTVFDSKDTQPALNSVGKITTARTYTLEPDLPGTSTLPALTTIVLAADGSPTEILTDPIPIQVTSVLSEGEAKPTDIVTSLSKEKPGHIRVIPIVVLFLGLLISTYFIKKRQQKITPPQPTTTDEDEKLLATLTDLPTSSILTAMETPLARIISHRYGITATDFTSLEKSSIPGLAPLIARHRKLCYSETPHTAAEVIALLDDFKNFIAKEAP